MNRALRIAGAIGLLLLGVWIDTPGRPAQGAHPLEWNGHRWSGLSPTEQNAYLAGFIAGASLMQVRAGSDGEVPLEVLESQTLAERKTGRLEFAYAPHVYRTRLADYYFYVDRRDRPIFRALAELNAAGRRRGR